MKSTLDDEEWVARLEQAEIAYLEKRGFPIDLEWGLPFDRAADTLTSL
jgi:hypothetical protein